MDCTYFRTLGSAIVDNEASESEIKEFNEHIATCGECAAWFETIKILKNETVALTSPAPPELKERVMMGVKNANKKPSLFSRFRFTAVAAVVAIIVFASGGIFTPPTEDVPTVINEQTPMSARMAPNPDKIMEGTDETETPSVPYDRAFSYIVYLHSDTLPDFLTQAEYEQIDGYRYYITAEKYDSLANFAHQIIKYNASLDLEGLIIVKE